MRIQLIIDKSIYFIQIKEVGEGGFEPPTPWSQTKIYAIRDPLMRIIPG